ncbi:M16 family metallopeptidase [Candidatus Palauibacter sp.]|uniref:M16 family metallopeptidase n=1 Tax=Candidatus Palauibacter sp. TaxID=3101350 RepID=UPI003AF2095C
MTPDRTTRPAPAAPRPLALPGFERHRLPNGLRLEFAERRDIPEVSLRLVLENGAGAEPPSRAGLAELTARLLTAGTPNRDAMDVARWLDRLGAGYHATAGYSVGTVSMHFLTEVFEEALDFLAATVLDSDFPEREVDRLRAERLDEIERQGDDPATVANLATIAELYGDGLYGRSMAGTSDTVAEISRDAVREFHEARFRPSESLLIVCGDVAPERLGPAVEARFGAWSGHAARVEPPPPPSAPESEVILIDRPGSPQTEIRVATIGVPYGTGDHHAIIVANAILGGLFNSRINLNLREDKGWTYGARTGFRFRRGAGPFVARTAVETARTGPAFEEILREIEAMCTQQVTPEEMKLARNALTLSLPLQFETAAQICGKVSRQRIFDLPDDYWETYRGRIDAVTPDQVREVCRKYLDRDRLTLLAVGDAAAAGPTLGGLGAVDVRSIA